MGKRRILPQIIGFFLAAISVSASSVGHGFGDDFKIFGRSVSKGWIVLALAILWTTLGWFLSCSPWGGAVGIVISILFWVWWRTGENAGRQLDYMTYVTDRLSAIGMGYWKQVLSYSLLIAGCAVYIQQPIYFVGIGICFLSLVPLLISASRNRQDAGESARHNRMRVEIWTPAALSSASLLLPATEAVQRLVGATCG